MKFRNICITNSAQLYHKLGFLFIRNKAHTIQIPLRDINCLILENRDVSITTSAVDNLIYHHVLIIGCNGKFLPSSITLPVSGRQNLRGISSQIHLSRRAKIRLWQKIIKRKIKNQARNLELHQCSNYQLLTILVRDVQPYDKTHIEAYSARIYFQSLFGKSFSRRKSCLINKALNYGYSLIRSMIARSIIANSLLPYLGIWHNNQFDTFALADDLIEPFRAIVDNFVLRNIVCNHTKLNRKDKHILLRLLSIRVNINAHHILINQAISLEVQSFAHCCINKSSQGLILPEL